MKSIRRKLVVAVGALATLATAGFSLYWLARVWTDYQWYRSVGRNGVFFTQLGSAFVVWVVCSAVALGVFVVAAAFTRRLLDEPPRWLHVLPVAGAAAAISGLTVSRQWMVLRPALADVEFGVRDPLFGLDVGFFVFKLPALEILGTWLNGLVVLCLVLILTAVLIPRRQGLIGVSDERKHRLKAIVSVLLGCLMLSAAFNHWLSVWRLDLDLRYAQAGAFYTDVHAAVPAYRILAATAIVVALVLFATARSRRVALPAGALGTWVMLAIVLGTAWPAVLQRLVVEPTEFALEKPYLERNIEMTRFAFGLTSVQGSAFPALETLSPGAAGAARDQLTNARIWTPQSVERAYEQLQTIRPYYRLSDIQPDRYLVDGTEHQVLVAAREIDTSALPSRARTWVNEHLVYTHGYGIAMCSASGVSAQGFPRFLVGGVPPKVSTEATESPDLSTREPRIYFGPNTTSFAVVNTGLPEFDHPQGEKNATYRYSGPDGVPLGSLLSRLAWTLRLNSSDIALSEYLGPESRILVHRSVKARAEKIAPWLELDSNPYPAVVDGRILWIIDGYTSSDRFPYSQPLSDGTNYLRNSVKVTVDAFSGETTFYANGDDPIRDAWAAIFPSVITPAEKVPVKLAEHFRVPERLFTAQADAYRTYHMTEADVFYNKEDQWQVARESKGSPVKPSYVLLDLPGGAEGPHLYLAEPFSPTDRDNIIGWMAEACDPEEYGTCAVWLLPKERVVLGPQQVRARINQDPEISPQLSLWNQRGSKVVFGEMAVLPVQGTIAYVQPIFLQAQDSAITELASVVVVTGERVEMDTGLSGALARAFETANEEPRQPSAPEVAADGVH